MKKLLPQANSLDVIIETFKYCIENPSYQKSELAEHIGYKPRQVDYYLNACIYLDLLGTDGKATEYSMRLYEQKDNLRLYVYEKILNDPLIGKIFTHYLIFSLNGIKDFAYKEVASIYPEYGDAVLRRRVSTILAWCEEIITFVRFS